MNYNNGNGFQDEENRYPSNLPRPTSSGVIGGNASNMHGTGNSVYNDQQNMSNPSMTKLEYTNNSYMSHNSGYQGNSGHENKYQNYPNGALPYTSYYGNSYNPIPAQYQNMQYNTQMINQGPSLDYYGAGDGSGKQHFNNLAAQGDAYLSTPSDVTDSPVEYMSASLKRGHDESRAKEGVSYADITQSKANISRKAKKQKKALHKKKAASTVEPQKDNVLANSLPVSEIRKVVDAQAVESGEHKEESDTTVQKIEETKTSPESETTSIMSKKELHQVDSNGSEDEEKAKTVNVPGTSIKLQTDEEIKKWRDERRSMWLLRISNNKEVHMKNMGVDEADLKKKSVLKTARKDNQFIQNIQNQVYRYNPKIDLNLKVVQREMAVENMKILQMIEELGDAGLLKCELTEVEKNKLFGGPKKPNQNFRNFNRNGRNPRINRRQ